jgi:hypothetical protein
MLLAVTILAAAISRADLVERFRAPSAIKCEGLVEVSGMCAADVRREFQLPVASSAAQTCRGLYEGLGLKPRKFKSAGILVFLGDSAETNAAVAASRAARPDGSRYPRITLPSPAYADLRAFRREVARGFLLAVNGEDADDARVEEVMRLADPELRLDDEYDDLRAWREKGEYRRGRGDEDYLKLFRRVKNPGKARMDDALAFSSRLMLYPQQYAVPFCGRYWACSFREAIDMAAVDPAVRFAAFVKSSELAVFGAGHGDEFTGMVNAYCDFLRALAAYDGKNGREALVSALDAADGKLKEMVK